VDDPPADPSERPISVGAAGPWVISTLIVRVLATRFLVPALYVYIRALVVSVLAVVLIGRIPLPTASLRAVIDFGARFSIGCILGLVACMVALLGLFARCLAGGVIGLGA
jgi:hypothetical protein